MEIKQLVNRVSSPSVCGSFAATQRSSIEDELKTNCSMIDSDTLNLKTRSNLSDKFNFVFSTLFFL